MEKEIPTLNARHTDEKCPKCGSWLLTNDLGDKWCSHIDCGYMVRTESFVQEVGGNG